jgi:xanthine dehydrogenase accessory factor
MHSYAVLFRSLGRAVQKRRKVAFCTVLATAGSVPQTPGASMLLHEDGSTEGTLGGGCVEAEVRQRALELLQRGALGRLVFSLDHDYGWDDSLICGGRMTVGVMSIRDEAEAAPFVEAADLLDQGLPAVVPVRVRADAGEEQYSLHIEAPAKLIIAGAGHVGIEVAKLAVRLDFDVLIIDDRADLMGRERVPEPIKPIVGDIAETLRRQGIDAGTFVIVVTRGHKHDEAALRAVIDRPARYLGMIGSRRKVKLIFDDLAAMGVDPAKLARVHSPIGLPIGSVTVPEIAISILAQLVQVRRTEKPTHIEGPIKPIEESRTSPEEPRTEFIRRGGVRAAPPPEKGPTP